MTPERIFALANLAVLPGWLILLLLPRWRFGARFISGAMLPALIGATYAFLILPGLYGAEGGFGSIDQVRTLFSDDALLTAGWLHYLAFDLFVGAWMVRDAQRLGVRHLLVVPCLPLTFMLGPIGLLAYLGLRWGLKQEPFLGTDPLPATPVQVAS